MIKKKFCWWPTRCVDGQWAWLEYVGVDLEYYYNNLSQLLDVREVYSKINKGNK